ncbi:MAG: hypothetical protein JSR48_14265 [Verrucomicrobia bacterium]|nr:hypothetical protein [Verrucomicrobiota bacterium]
MSLRLLPLRLALLGGFAAAVLAQAADDTRFSATLNAAERAATGLNQLAPDDVAVIDGLVRQDLAASRYRHNSVDGTRFTQRRTVRERELAGLDHLTPAQQARLDELVRRRIDEANPAAPVAVTDFVDPGAAAGVRTVRYVPPTEVHGQVSYTVGGGRGGSFQGGAVELSYDDPAHRYSVAVGYSVFHGKGLPFCFGPADAPFGPLPGPY